MRVRWWVPVGVVAVVAAAIVAFAVASSGRPSGTPSARLAGWVASAKLGQSIGTLVDDGHHVAEALARHQGTTAVHTVCAVMANDAQTANDNLPSPDTAVTVALARAYALEYDAGEACYRGGATGASLLAESAGDRRRAEAIFEQVLARVARVTGRTVPTTTTTVPGGASTVLG
ncbi:MAG: hypothetical protein ACRDY3_07195 [Acidimicrobiales bacterium]